jgi:hypothetical protein
MVLADRITDNVTISINITDAIWRKWKVGFNLPGFIKKIRKLASKNVTIEMITKLANLMLSGFFIN